MSYRQLIQCNPDTAGNIGYCLAFGESAFNAPHIYPYAFTAWENTQFRHPNEEPPTDVAVPIWFSYIVGDLNEGHIAINVPGRGILSSPWQPGTTQAWLPSIAELERIYSNNGAHPLTYVGWSEDIAGIRVVEAIIDTPVDLPTQKYQVIETYDPAKQIQLNKQPTYLWGMNYDFDTMVNSPVEIHNQGEIWPVTNRVHHEDGYDYYRRDGQVDGFNVADCDDYTLPPPLSLPSAPVKGTPAETYTLVTSLPTYNDDLGAIGRSNGSETLLPVGTYYVWAKIGNVYQLGIDNVHAPTNNWINTLDNVAPTPAPVIPTPTVPPTDSSTTVIGSFKWFHADHRPEDYLALKNLRVYDMVHGGTSIPIDVGETIQIYGHFVKDGHTYLRHLTGLDQQALYYFYGILTTDSATFSGIPNLQAKLNWIQELKAIRESLWEKAVKSIDGVFRRKK